MTRFNTTFNSITTLEDAVHLSRWARPAIEILRRNMIPDAAHDEGHLVRVINNAIWFTGGEEIISDPDVLIPACILHDLVNYPKDHPLRARASLYSADKAIDELEDLLPFKSAMHHAAIHHAIEAHSYSANVKPRSAEAIALQDADRVDALGALGLARLFAVSGTLGRPLFHPTDPLAEARELDELTYGLDHFATKLAHLYGGMHTRRGKDTAAKRTGKMIQFIRDLVDEVEIVSDTWLRRKLELDDRIDNFIVKGHRHVTLQLKGTV